MWTRHYHRMLLKKCFRLLCIKKRLSETSSNDIFDEHLKPDQDSLKDSGFSNNLRYVENNSNANNSKRKQKLKMIWFNPPFFKRIKTNIGIFLIGSIISAHNWDILNPFVNTYGCNCRARSSCSLNGECVTPKVIYRANVSSDANNNKNLYFVLADRKVHKPKKGV